MKETPLPLIVWATITLGRMLVEQGNADRRLPTPAQRSRVLAAPDLGAPDTRLRDGRPRHGVAHSDQALRAANAPRTIHYLSLDVEGAEYEVLEHLLSTGVACWFRDGVSLEWHETAERARANERQRIMRRLRACGIGVRTEEGVSRYVS